LLLLQTQGLVELRASTDFLASFNEVSSGAFETTKKGFAIHTKRVKQLKEDLFTIMRRISRIRALLNEKFQLQLKSNRQEDEESDEGDETDSGGDEGGEGDCDEGDEVSQEDIEFEAAATASEQKHQHDENRANNQLQLLQGKTEGEGG